jgi:two-component system CheB/CheR fusion protein
MTSVSTFPIIGVGASAGGVEALEGFFKGMPPHPNLAVVVVTHLNPERESVLHEIIARYTQLDVQKAVDGARVIPDTVFVLQADALIGISGGRLQVTKANIINRERKPIDIFLSALAKDQGECAGSVILSGLDGDGTLGTKAIKERGGLTMAQAPDGFGPSHPGMPQSAMSTGYVDFYVPASEMGGKLAEFARSVALQDSPSAEADGDFSGEAARAEIYGILRTQVGHDFSGYKTKTFIRRLKRRMQVVQLSSVEGYIERLRQDPKEVSALFRDLLINVTNFFRDAAAFEKLKEVVIPKLFEGRGPEDNVRIWVPGCATGEEVFSIAMLMREHMDGLAAVPRVQIFATDIDDLALAVARTGRYPEALLDSVSIERRQRFFTPDGGSYVISKDVRDLCIFSPHSVIRDPPFSRIDLVSCRNLLIYFGPDIQNQVLPIFHYALRPGGYLFLGTSENVNQFAELFAPVEKQHRIFRSREAGRSHIRLPMAVSGLLQTVVGSMESRPHKGLAWRQTIEASVLERFGPAFVVVTRDADVVHFSAGTGKYLEQIAGVPSRQLLTIARKGLRYDLRVAFREAVENGNRVVREHLPIEADDGRIRLTSLTIEPVSDSRDIEPLYIVLFADEPEPSPQSRHVSGDAAAESAAAHLERELNETKERLQSLIEEYETALEELKSSNEELVSVNEELQSTNEELEASKEELQSLNEELHTVNMELSGKVEALDRANSDLHNLFESTQVATVFLDKNLLIRSFTPAVSQIVNILPTDKGRPITDLSSPLFVPSLAADISSVLASGEAIEYRVDRENGGGHHLIRLVPYRDSDNHLSGVVATFIDVPDLHAEGRQRGSLGSD